MSANRTSPQGEWLAAIVAADARLDELVDHARDPDQADYWRRYRQAKAREDAAWQAYEATRVGVKRQ